MRLTKRGIGAVFEQAPDEIGEQLLVASDRRVDPHRRARIADRVLELGQLLVQRLAHAVQALELERPALRQRLHLADGVRIVGRERRVDDVAGVEQRLRAGEIGDVGRDLAREHRIIGQARDLRRLDLGVPVSALDQTDHQLAAMRPGGLGDPFAQRHSALLIGLDRDPEPAPDRPLGEQLVVGEQRLEHVELQLEPVGLLGIDGEMDVGLGSLERELAHDRQHRGDRFGLHAYIRSADGARSA